LNGSAGFNVKKESGNGRRRNAVIRQERQRRKKAEERLVWALFTVAECWHKSQQIRAYVQAVKDTAEKTLETIKLESSLEECIAWALKQADRLDPLAPLSCCTREDRHDDLSAGRRESYGFHELCERTVKRSAL
jgi:hypothetical protein